MTTQNPQKNPVKEDTQQRLLSKRIIWLGSDVRDDNSNDIASKLLLLDAERPGEEIKLFINSPGGSITAGMVIYDMMQHISSPVSTVAMGLAASMGQFLLSSGTKGRRYATPHTRVMMHQPSGGIGGTATDALINLELIQNMKEVLAALIAEQTGQDFETITRDSDRDRWFTAPEALEYGFIDGIMGPDGKVYTKESGK